MIKQKKIKLWKSVFFCFQNQTWPVLTQQLRSAVKIHNSILLQLWYTLNIFVSKGIYTAFWTFYFVLKNTVQSKNINHKWFKYSSIIPIYKCFFFCNNHCFYVVTVLVTIKTTHSATLNWLKAHFVLKLFEQNKIGYKYSHSKMYSKYIF